MELAADIFAKRLAKNFTEMANMTVDRHEKSLYGLYYNLDKLPEEKNVEMKD